MIVSTSNALFCPKHRLSFPAFVSTMASTIFSCRLNYISGIRCFNNGNRYMLHIANGYFKGKVLSMSNDEGMWEDPHDVSDDSEYEDYADTDDESEDMQENDLDYESDWEAKRNVKVSVSNADELSTSDFDEDLAREVEQLLTPKEREILEQNEAPNPEKLSTAKWKPFHSFALAGHIKFMDVMLENGCDIDMVDMDGMTALHHAVVRKREPVISHLLRKGANPKAKDLDGTTPLHYAVQVGAMQTVKLLMKYKVDVNAADNEGWTPLHVVMQTRNRELGKILLVNGADKTRKNKDGNTPIDLSICYGKEFKSYEIAKMLKQVPANRGL